MALSKMPAQALSGLTRLCHTSCLDRLCSLEPVTTDSHLCNRNEAESL